MSAVGSPNPPIGQPSPSSSGLRPEAPRVCPAPSHRIFWPVARRPRPQQRAESLKRTERQPSAMGLKPSHHSAPEGGQAALEWRLESAAPAEVVK